MYLNAIVHVYAHVHVYVYALACVNPYAYVFVYAHAYGYVYAQTYGRRSPSYAVPLDPRLMMVSLVVAFCLTASILCSTTSSMPVSSCPGRVPSWSAARDRGQVRRLPVGRPGSCLDAWPCACMATSAFGASVELLARCPVRGALWVGWSVELPDVAMPVFCASDRVPPLAATVYPLLLRGVSGLSSRPCVPLLSCSSMCLASLASYASFACSTHCFVSGLCQARLTILPLQAPGRRSACEWPHNLCSLACIPVPRHSSCAHRSSSRPVVRRPAVVAASLPGDALPLFVCGRLRRCVVSH